MHSIASYQRQICQISFGRFNLAIYNFPLSRILTTNISWSGGDVIIVSLMWFNPSQLYVVSSHVHVVIGTSHVIFILFISIPSKHKPDHVTSFCITWCHISSCLMPAYNLYLVLSYSSEWKSDHMTSRYITWCHNSLWYFVSEYFYWSNANLTTWCHVTSCDVITGCAALLQLPVFDLTQPDLRGDVQWRWDIYGSVWFHSWSHWYHLWLNPWKCSLSGLILCIGRTDRVTRKTAPISNSPLIRYLLFTSIYPLNIW